MAEPLPLVNLFDVETEEGPKTLICFLDAVMAGATGITPQSIVGLHVTNEAGEFDPTLFEVNPTFIEALTIFMNERVAQADEVKAQALELPSGWLYIIDPRHPEGDIEDPPTSDVVGMFAVDASGQIAPKSFQYNQNHVIFDTTHGVTGMLLDRNFYQWLHGATV